MTKTQTKAELLAEIQRLQEECKASDAEVYRQKRLKEKVEEQLRQTQEWLERTKFDIHHKDRLIAGYRAALVMLRGDSIAKIDEVLF